MLGSHVVNNCLLAPVHVEPDEGLARQLQSEILAQTVRHAVKGVIIDVSAVRFMDSKTFRVLTETSRMVSLMGVMVVFVGLPAGVTASLLDINVDSNGINTAITLQDAFELIENTECDDC